MLLLSLIFQSHAMLSFFSYVHVSFYLYEGILISWSLIDGNPLDVAFITHYILSMLTKYSYKQLFILDIYYTCICAFLCVYMARVYACVCVCIYVYIDDSKLFNLDRIIVGELNQLQLLGD